ncbi:hypothetical protein ACA910_000840 [Epithemia clementina (nom. ined.)]
MTIYLFLENPAKNNNLGPVIRCASAFGIQTIVAVGFAKCAVEGSHGASKHVQLVAFPTAAQAVSHLRATATTYDNTDNDATKTCTIQFVGLLGGIPNGYEQLSVNLDPRCYPQDTGVVVPESYDNNHNSSNNTSSSNSDNPEEWRRTSFPISDEGLSQLLLGGNNNQNKNNNIDGRGGNILVIAVSKHPCGLSYQLAKHCDWFLHVPHVAIPILHQAQPSQNKSKNNSNSHNGSVLPPPSSSLSSSALYLLDLPATLSIALHHITIHLGYQEGKFEGQKFLVNHKTNHHHRHPGGSTSSGYSVDKGDDNTEQVEQMVRLERVRQRMQLQQAADDTIGDGVLSFMMDDDGDVDNNVGDD